MSKYSNFNSYAILNGHFVSIIIINNSQLISIVISNLRRGVQAIVFVIDSADAKLMENAKKELFELL